MLRSPALWNFPFFVTVPPWLTQTPAQTAGKSRSFTFYGRHAVAMFWETRRQDEWNLLSFVRHNTATWHLKLPQRWQCKIPSSGTCAVRACVRVWHKFSNISEHPVVFMATEGPGMTEARGSLKAHGVTCQNIPCSRVSAVRIVKQLRTNCLCYCPSWPMKSEFQVAWNVTPCRSVNTNWITCSSTCGN
jgi:hypothetical protein